MSQQKRVVELKDKFHAMIDSAKRSGKKGSLSVNEGHMTVGVEYEKNKKPHYFITCDTYMLGGHQARYQWSDSNMERLLDKFENILDTWGKKF